MLMPLASQQQDLGTWTGSLNNILSAPSHSGSLLVPWRRQACWLPVLPLIKVCPMGETG